MPGPSTNPIGSVRNVFVVLVPTTNASVGANTTAERTFTVPGLLLGFDAVHVNKPTHQTGLGIVNSRVSADNTLAITYMNNTGGGITPTSESYLVTVMRHDYPALSLVPAGIA